jgi:hypothetical protein
LNATYLGYFKQNTYELGHKYINYFLDGGILTKAKVTRMGETELSSDLLVSLMGGVQTNKNVESYYRDHEDEPGGVEDQAQRFDNVMAYLGAIYPAEEIKTTNWSRIHLFFTLFNVIAHGLYNIKNLDPSYRPEVNKANVGRLRVIFDEISARYDEYTGENQRSKIPTEFLDFIEKSRRWTTDTGARVGRANFLCKLVVTDAK